VRRIDTPPDPQDAGVDLSPTQWSRDEINARLAAWRQRFQPGAVEEGKPLEPPESEALEAARPGGWRAHVATWARAIRLGAQRPPPEERGLLDALGERLQLDGELAHGVALLYGAYLN